MQRLSVVSVVLAFACSSKASAPVTPKPEPSRGVPPTVAKLFELGKKWSWPTKVVTRSFEDDKEQTTTADGTLACEVVATTAKDGTWTTKLACNENPELPSPFPRELVATSTGLWEQGFETDPKHRLIDEPPVPRDNSVTHEAAEGMQESGVSKAGDRWCFWYSQAVQGSTSSWRMCMRDGEFVGGSSTSGGAQFIEATWGDHGD
jgi:hypothetical protein